MQIYGKDLMGWYRDEALKKRTRSPEGFRGQRSLYGRNILPHLGRRRIHPAEKNILSLTL